MMARQSNIMFSNLRAEMARQQVTIQGIANVIGVGRDAASQKLWLLELRGGWSCFHQR